MPRASVIVPARDAELTLPRTLEALARQELEGGHEVIVVDDGSSDRTVELARAARGGVRVIRQDRLGPAAARNSGARGASGEILAFCDADVYPAAGWLAAGAAALAQADLVQGCVLPDPAVRLGPFDRTLWVRSLSGLWETANLFVTRELFWRVGGFERWLAPRSGKDLAEDVWFGYRATRAGARAAFCPTALAYHAVFGRGPRDYIAERRRTRYFPAMAARVPELRDQFLYRRWFLSDRSARLDLALLGLCATLVSRRPEAMLTCLPYLLELRRHSQRARPQPPRALLVALGDAAADLMGLASLLEGSLSYRSLVL